MRTLGSVPLSPSLTENIMRNIGPRENRHLLQEVKPLLPLAGLGASAILVHLTDGRESSIYCELFNSRIVLMPN